MKKWIIIFLSLIFLGADQGALNLQDETEKLKKLSISNLLLTKPQLFEDIRENETITFFAPTDESFEQLDPELVEALQNDDKLLKALIQYHTVLGEYPMGELQDGDTLESMEGQGLQVTEINGEKYINDAKIIEGDSIMRRGTLHTIDKVLLPEGVGLEELKKEAQEN